MKNALALFFKGTVGGFAGAAVYAVMVGIAADTLSLGTVIFAGSLFGITFGLVFAVMHLKSAPTKATTFITGLITVALAGSILLAIFGPGLFLLALATHFVLACGALMSLAVLTSAGAWCVCSI